MDLRTYWLAAKAGWRIILGAALVVVAAVAVLSWPSAPTYVSTVKLYVATANGAENLQESYQRSAIALQRMASYVALAATDSVANEVSDVVGGSVDPQSMTVAAEPGTVIIAIAVRDTDPERAQAVAQAYGEVLPSAIEAVDGLHDDQTAPVKVTVIDQADLPESPVPTPLVRNLLAGLILGLGVGVGAAVLRHVLASDQSQDEARPAGEEDGAL